MDLNHHQDFVWNGLFVTQATNTGPNETEARVERWVAHHDDRIVILATALFEPRPDKLRAGTLPLVRRQHGHGPQASDARVRRWTVDLDETEKDMPDQG